MKQICYKTSKDYKRLKELVDKGVEVVCFIIHESNSYRKDEDGYHNLLMKDVCYCRKLIISYQFVAGDKIYATYKLGMQPYNSFEQMAEEFDIEFIEPTITF